ncbi:MotA/TolQ/ExbB proton channel family protein [bacterium]|nr:MotA/TolQ/ExbB proton channel family protein [bacterium]
MGIDVLETARSSFVMIILLGCSMVAITFMFERWLFLKRAMINAEQFFQQVREAIQRGGRESGISVCSVSISSLATVIRAGLETPKNGPKAAEEIMDAVAMDERLKLEKNLNVLGTLGNIAPLVGLFGTVLGIIQAFNSMAITGSGGPAVISAGIAEALVTTAAGLVVAVPAVVAYNFFVRRVNRIMTDIESVSKKVNVLMTASN